MRRFLAVAALALPVVLPALAAADEYGGPGFSGDTFLTPHGGPPQMIGTMHVDRRGLRMDLDSHGQRVSSLYHWDGDTVYSLYHDQKLYFETPAEQAGMRIYEDRPCVGFTGGTKLGVEAVDGRMTEKWRCSGEVNPPPDRPAVDATVWYDRELKFEIKVAQDGGQTFEFRNIAVGRPDLGLFEVPADFEKLNPQVKMPEAQKPADH